MSHSEDVSLIAPGIIAQALSEGETTAFSEAFVDLPYSRQQQLLKALHESVKKRAEKINGEGRRQEAADLKRSLVYWAGLITDAHRLSLNGDR